MKASLGDSSEESKAHKSQYSFTNLFRAFTYDGLLNWICSSVDGVIRVVGWPLFAYFGKKSVTSSLKMSIATLILHWDSLNAAKTGWRVKINGLLYSQREDFKRRFPDKVKEEDPNGQTLIVTAEEEPAFDRNNPYDLPMYVVVQYLKVLGEMKYKVVATHSIATQDYSHSTTMWTLQII